ncbi:transposase [Bounagaea algeriensis]
MTVEQRARLRAVLQAGAQASGFATDGWTLTRVRRIIASRSDSGICPWSRGVSRNCPWRPCVVIDPATLHDCSRSTRRGWWHDTALIRLLDQAHQQLQTPLILIWDRLDAHRSHRMRRAIAARSWLEVEYLPAPRPQPTEGLWSSLKRTALANLAARTLDELTTAVHVGLTRLQRRSSLLTSFLTHAGLDHPQLTT